MITASPPRTARACAHGTVRRLARRAGCALALAAMLAAPPALAAGARGARCTTARGRRPHSCTQSRRTRSAAPRHALTRRKAAHRPAHPPAHPTPGSSAVTRTTPSCEDGSSAVKAGRSLRCDDGSEPACEPPSVPTLSAKGVLRFCTTPTGSSHPAEGACEAGAECVDAEDLSEAPCTGGEASAAGEEAACEGTPAPAS